MESTIERQTYNETEFWLDHPTILIEKQYIFDVIPTKEMNTTEKLNSLMRLSIYVGIVLYILTSKYEYLYIPIVTSFITILIEKSYKDQIEHYFQFYTEKSTRYLNDGLDNNDPIEDNSRFYNDPYQNREGEKETQEIINRNYKNKVLPTNENPFMNINLITNDMTRKNTSAVPSWNNIEVQKNINDKFNVNLYRDAGDLYAKNNSQREYYTMPSTTIPNNQNEFAKFCYQTGPTCKEDSIYCTSPMAFDNSIAYSVDDSNVYTPIDRKY
jgi:hypothetical protein